MQQNLIMEFKRGDGLTHYFQVPEDSYEAESKLFFAAKPQPDDDTDDLSAVIDKEFGDSDIVDDTHEEYVEGLVTYELAFVPNDITVSFADGSTNKRYLGEFQYIPAGGFPSSSPEDDNFIEVIVYADIKRGT